MIRVQVEVDGLENLLGAPVPHLMTALNHGAFLGAQMAQGVWISLARAAGLRRDGAYVNAINSRGAVRMVKGAPSLAAGAPMPNRVEFIFEVVNDSEHAQIIEEGHSAFHLPSRVDWGSGSGSIKRGKKGPYLHIPFEHRAYASPSKRKKGGYTVSTIKAMMPSDIHREAKKMGAVLRRHMGPIRDPSGQFVAADRYQRPKDPHTLVRPHMAAGFRHHRGEWVEERRSERQVAPGHTNPAWQASKFAGLFKAGAKGHEQYLTIRTMTPQSRGWNIPARHGHFLAEKTAQAVAREDRLGRAVMAGVEHVLGGGG